MKLVAILLNYLFAFATIFITVHYMNAGDICKTIFGCTAILIGFLSCREEN